MDGNHGDVTERPHEAPKVHEARDLQHRIERAKEFVPREKPDASKLTQVEKARVKSFEQEFNATTGADHVVLDAKEGTDKDRIGALHQMRVGQELDGQVGRFEEPLHPIEDGKPASRSNHVDIVTKDGYAVECKATGKSATYPSQLKQDAFEQATTRLADNTEGKRYKGVVVVFEDGKLSGDMRTLADHLETQQPGLRFCETSQVKQVLAEMRQRKRR